ncbi:hypothetical protein DMH15_30740, partial [Streptomyces sp. WAC 06725]
MPFRPLSSPATPARALRAVPNCEPHASRPAAHRPALRAPDERRTAVHRHGRRTPRRRSSGAPRAGRCARPLYTS